MENKQKLIEKLLEVLDFTNEYKQIEEYKRKRRKTHWFKPAEYAEFFLDVAQAGVLAFELEPADLMPLSMVKPSLEAVERGFKIDYFKNHAKLMIFQLQNRCLLASLNERGKDLLAAIIEQIELDKSLESAFYPSFYRSGVDF